MKLTLFALTLCMGIAVADTGSYSVYWNTPPEHCSYCDSTTPQALHTADSSEAWAKYYSISYGSCDTLATFSAIFINGTLAQTNSGDATWLKLIEGKAVTDAVLQTQPKFAYYACKYNADDCGTISFAAATDDPDAAYDAYYSQVQPHGGALIVNGTIQHHSDVRGDYCSDTNTDCGPTNALWCLGQLFESP